MFYHWRLNINVRLNRQTSCTEASNCKELIRHNFPCILQITLTCLNSSQGPNSIGPIVMTFNSIEWNKSPQKLKKNWSVFQTLDAVRMALLKWVCQSQTMLLDSNITAEDRKLKISVLQAQAWLCYLIRLLIWTLSKWHTFCDKQNWIWPSGISVNLVKYEKTDNLQLRQYVSSRYRKP